jgi:hypothetical protein
LKSVPDERSEAASDAFPNTGQTRRDNQGQTLDNHASVFCETGEPVMTARDVRRVGSVFEKPTTPKTVEKKVTPKGIKKIKF